MIFCINAAYGGIKLGNCWQIIEERYPEHRKSTRNPYAVIGWKAFGNFGRLVRNRYVFSDITFASKQYM